MLPDLPAILWRGDNADEGPRKLSAAECSALDEHMPKDGLVHDGLSLTDGRNPFRAMRTGFRVYEVTQVVFRMRELGVYDPLTQEETARAQAFENYKFFMNERIRKLNAAGAERRRAIHNMPGGELIDDDEEYPEEKERSSKGLSSLPPAPVRRSHLGNATAAGTAPGASVPSVEGASSQPERGQAVLPWRQIDDEDEIGPVLRF